jgi:hypothetical protein
MSVLYILPCCAYELILVIPTSHEGLGVAEKICPHRVYNPQGIHDVPIQYLPILV